MIGQAERLYQLRSLVDSAPCNNSRIITITSGKGGTGKSFLAGNLALELAKKGVKVLLIDLDINFANQKVIFNTSTSKSIYHYFIYNKSLDDLTYNYCENLDIIFGESGKIDHPEFTANAADRLILDIKSLNNGYDIILIDSGSGMDSGSRQVLLKSDEIILLATPEPTSVMDGYVVFKMLKSHGISNKLNVIINKCLDKSEADEAFNNLNMAVSHFLKIESNFLGWLSFSPDVMKSIKNQIPLIISSESHEINTQLKQISTDIRIPTIG